MASLLRNFMKCPCREYLFPPQLYSVRCIPNYFFLNCVPPLLTNSFPKSAAIFRAARWVLQLFLIQIVLVLSSSLFLLKPASNLLLGEVQWLVIPLFSVRGYGLRGSQPNYLSVRQLSEFFSTTLFDFSALRFFSFP